MECTLMHKNIEVVDMTIDITGVITKLSKVRDERHLPVGVRIYSSGIDRKALSDWWVGRSIPASRMGLRDALDALDITSSTFLIEKCYGLSLSDHYWIRPQDSGLTWDSINFFAHDFSRDMGEILFGNAPEDQNAVDLMSPDNTSDGWLSKKWIIADGKRWLIKSSSGAFKQEAYNEVIASEIMRRLSINHVTYSMIFDNGTTFSRCENFITPTTELVPTARVIDVLKRDNRDSAYAHLLRCCDTLGIPNVKPDMEKMLTIDYIINNEDRHYNNFGFLRNPETLEWIALAPVFDSGTSLWYESISVGEKRPSKPFKSSHDEQIKLVQNLKWYDASKLDGIDEFIIRLFDGAKTIDEHRRKRIADHICERAKAIGVLSRQSEAEHTRRT